MAEVLNWIDKLQAIGVAGLALLFLYLTAKYFIKRSEEERAEAQDRENQLRKDYQSVIDRKDNVINTLSDQLREAAEQSRADMERHLVRQTEEVQRLEATIQQNTAAVSGLQDVTKDVRDRLNRRGGD